MRPPRSRLTAFFAAPAPASLLLMLAGLCSVPSAAPALEPPRAADAKVQIEFPGAAAFSRKALLGALSEQVTDIAEHGLNAATADDAAYYLGAFYRRNGFVQARVDYQIRGPVLVLNIFEGPRTVLGGIRFTGATAVPEATLWEYFLGATPEQLARNPEGFPLNESELSAGADRVRGLYLSEGFLNATVDASEISSAPQGGRATVTVRITEGPRYRFDDVRFEGAGEFSRDQLIEALGGSFHGPFSPAKAADAQRNLQSFLRARGYYQAEVAMDADPAKAVNGLVPVTFTLQAGPLFRFDGVNVTGTTRLRPSFLPRRFAHLKGQTYDPAKLDETFREMLRTGLFKNLRIAPVPQPDHTLRLDMTVEEAKARELGFTLGAGSYEGLSLGVRLADRNLFGNGRPLSLAIDYSQRGLRGELLYVDPWFLESRFNLRARLFSELRDEEGYSKTAAGVRLEVGRRVLAHLDLGAFVEQASVTVTSSGIDPSMLGPTNYLLSSAGLTSQVDFRDDPINPTRGMVLGTALSLSAIDGNPAFTRSTVRFSYYRTMGPTLLALGARAGWLAPLGQDGDLPIDVRFFNGGATTVRSFAERALGPKDRSGDPVGGELFTVFNAELTFPLYRALQGAAFVDVGNLSRTTTDGLSDMRSAVGLGLRYKLPIGPLRLDYGLNPAPRGDEARGAFHFSFGFAF